MRLQEIYNDIDRIAPFALSEEYVKRFGAYDNSGILLDCGEEITGVLFSLDLSSAAVDAAKEAGANCIVTHHPAIYAPLKKLAGGEGGEMLACARAGISVVSAHLNLDAAEGGIDACLMEGLGGSKPRAVYGTLSGGAYGRVYDVEETDFAEFVARAKRTLPAERTVSYGEGRVRRVASFCGAGFDEGTLAFALSSKADTFVSSDGKHHLIAAAIARGLNVLLLTHYAAENYGFCRFADKLTKKWRGTDCAVFTDRRFL